MKKTENYIKFLGTAGARFVMIKQLRSSGGIWISYEGTNILIDPGPGSIVRCNASRPHLDPAKLDAVMLTHRHLDHSNDINVMIEAMTEGGFKKRGVAFCPKDAVEKDAVILSHFRNSLEKIEFLEESKTYNIGAINFSTPFKNIHTVQTYGFKFKFKDKDVSLISDTRFSEALKDAYKAEIIILNVVFTETRPGVDHLNLQEAEYLIEEIKPEKAILTHFGMTMLKAKPHILAEELTKKLGIEVIAAYDGMTFKL